MEPALPDDVLQTGNASAGAPGGDAQALRQPEDPAACTDLGGDPALRGEDLENEDGYIVDSSMYATQWLQKSNYVLDHYDSCVKKWIKYLADS